jgi:uncharacterized protein (TIGR03000 family)
MNFASRAAHPAGGFYFGGYRAGFVGGYNFRPYYGWGAYHPSYGGYANYYSYYNPYANYSYYPYGYSYSTPGSMTDPYGTSTLQAQLDNRAYVTVIVPDGARVWFDGTATTFTGRVREYVTPPLAPGERSTYWVRARWSENGHEMNQLQPVEVTAGGRFDVRFPAPSRTGE